MGKVCIISDLREACLWTIVDHHYNGTLRSFLIWQEKGINANRYMGSQVLIVALPHSIKRQITNNLNMQESKFILICRTI